MMRDKGDKEACLNCGRPIDNEDGTGYCSECATDTGAYAQRHGLYGEAAADLRLLVDHLREDVAAILWRLEQGEAKLAAAEERLRLLEGGAEGQAKDRSGASPRGAESERCPGDSQAAGSYSAAPSKQEPDRDEGPISTLEARARSLGVDYARLRKLYSEEQLRELLEEREEEK